jgi:hypothetical protein
MILSVVVTATSEGFRYPTLPRFVNIRIPRLDSIVHGTSIQVAAAE